MTQEQVINGAALKDMALFGAALLEKNKAYIDELNVFPVPDGDTGTNMSMTMNAATKEILTLEDTASIGEVSALIARGALRGARGNSGVILSQVFRGIAKGLEGKENADGAVWAQALQMASDAAYKAVLKPKEGTILTVIRVVAEKAVLDAKVGKNVYQIIDNCVINGEEILAQTPQMLPVLKEANVVDSGGAGLLMVFRGFKMMLDGELIGDLTDSEWLAPTLELPAQTDENLDNHDIALIEDVKDIQYGYCTEFFVEHLREGFQQSEADHLLEALQEIGDSAVVVNDADLIKVHIHTDMPGKVLQMALRLGEITGIKIENMREQNRQLKKERKAKEKDFGMVAISAGDGLEKIFKDLGVDVVLSGGQTMNPSAEDIEKAVKRVNAKNVFVLPNNKNIILAARQAAKLFNKASGIHVSVIPTETIVEGISSAIAFSNGVELKDKEKMMKKAAKDVVSGSITFAVRDTTIKGRPIAKDDYMGVVDGDIVSNGSSMNDVFDQMVAAMMKKDSSFVSIFYGNGTSKEEAEAMGARVEEQYPEVDFEIQEGGQPLYYYFVSVE